MLESEQTFVEKNENVEKKNGKDSVSVSIQAKERASRNGSTVVDISIPPPSFKSVSLYLSRSPFSKTPKQVFFNPYKYI